MFQNIPYELRALPQWVLWRAEETQNGKPTKIPYQARNGHMASVTKPEHWTTFEAVMAAMQSGWYTGVGFVFTEADPFTGIDLDATDNEALRQLQQQVYNRMHSYTEFSPSGTGVHIIVTGVVPTGRRRNSIEVYSKERFFTMTGNVLNPAPINHRQEELSELWQQLGGSTTTTNYAGTMDQTDDDLAIWTKAKGAANGAKFESLWNGDWERTIDDRTGRPFSSQSEADLALVNIIAFYTQNREQIARLFRQSALGYRDKAKRNDYVGKMIDKSFDKIPPPADFEAMKREVEGIIAAIKKAPPAEEINSVVPVVQPMMVAPVEQPSWNPYTLPPGLLGEIAEFIYAASPRPIPQIALAGAMGLMAGICGRAYNVSATGLNLYILLLAGTGKGKEAIAGGIDRLMRAARNVTGGAGVPSINTFRGPAEIASGQALIKFMKDNPSFVSVVGEFGLRMQQMASPRASTAEISLKRALLDLYMKSGHSQSFQPMIYADKDKNSVSIDSPALSLIGESTPETFWSCVDERLIIDGLLPRFSIIEYEGLRPRLSTTHSHAVPSLSLVKNVQDLATDALTLMHNHNVINVTLDDEAQFFMDQFEDYCTDQINAPQENREVVANLWNRAHIKAMRIAALVAVGCNRTHPCITVQHAQWAKAIVVHEVTAILKRFTNGMLGAADGEAKQRREVINCFREYLSQPFSSTMSTYGASPLMHSLKVVPHVYFSRRLGAKAAFKGNFGGSPTQLINRTLQALIEEDTVRLLNRNDASQFQSTQKFYVLNDLNLLLAPGGTDE